MTKSVYICMRYISFFFLFFFLSFFLFFDLKKQFHSTKAACKSWFTSEEILELIMGEFPPSMLQSHQQIAHTWLTHVLPCFLPFLCGEFQNGSTFACGVWFQQ